MRTRACNFEWFHGHLCLHNIMRVTEDIIYVRKPRVHRDTLHVHNILRFRIPLDPRAHNIMLRRAHPCPCASSALYYAYTTTYHVCVCVYTYPLSMRSEYTYILQRHLTRHINWNNKRNFLLYGSSETDITKSINDPSFNDSQDGKKIKKRSYLEGYLLDRKFSKSFLGTMKISPFPELQL